MSSRVYAIYRWSQSQSKRTWLFKVFNREVFGLFCLHDIVLQGNSFPIVWAHRDSIKLLNSFSILLICDTTYKYRLLLLEIVVTSTNMAFIIVFTYLSYERMDNFEALSLCSIIWLGRKTVEINNLFVCWMWPSTRSEVDDHSWHGLCHC